MKKITLMLFALVAFCWQSNAQLNEGFDTAGLPTGWTETQVSGTDNWVSGATSNQNGSVVPRTGAGMAYFSTSNYNHDTTRLETPSQDLSSLTSPLLTFYYTQVDWSGDQDKLSIWYKDGAAGTWTMIVEYSASVTAWTEVNIILPNPSADYYIGFQGDGFWGRGITLDDVSIAEAPSCLAPGSLGYLPTSTTSGTLSWLPSGSETDFTYEFGAPGFTPGTGTEEGTGMVTANSADISGLVAGTDYEFYIQANCGVDGDSAYSGPFSWSQPDTGEACGTAFVATLEADCGTATPISLDFTGAPSNISTSCDSFNNFGLWVTTTTDATGGLRVNASAAVDMAIFDSCGGTDIECYGTGIFPNVDVMLSPNTTYYMYFWQEGTASTAMVDVCMTLPPSCLEPSGLTATTTGLDAVDITWTAGDAETEWTYEYGVSPYAQGGGGTSGTVMTTPSLSLSALTPGETYDIYLQANCGPGDDSPYITTSWTQPVVGSTCEAAINVAALPYTTTDDTANYGDDYTGSAGATGCGTTSSYLNGDDVVYEYTAIADGTIKLSMSAIGSTYSGIFVYTDCANIGTECVAGFGNGGSTADYNIDVAVTNGTTYYIVISTWATPQSTTYTLDITEVLCAEPSGLAATTTGLDTADITWTAGGAETDWTYEYGVSPYTQGGGGTSGTVMTTPSLSLTGLTPGETYDIYVQTNCGVGNDSPYVTTSWTQPVVGATCETAIDVAALPYNTSDDTANYGDNYSGSAGATGCGTTSNYLNGDDVVYAYTATADATINIAMSAIGSTYSGLFVYTDCANIGTECVAGFGNGFSTDDYNLEVSVTNGTTYYIVISTWATPQSTTYTLDITENTCVNAEATYTVVEDCANTQFSVDVDVTSLGTATSVTISDDQGSADQQVSATGIVSFGPYASGTTVNYSILNDQDASCEIMESVSYNCPPMNDECLNATALTPGAVFADNPVDGTVAGATADAETASCGSNGPGVWYSIAVPASGDITIEVSDDSLGGTGFDSVIEAFSGVCGALVSLGCDDDGAAGFDGYSQLELTGLTGGETIYVRVWEYGGNEEEPFSISAFSASLSIDDVNNEAAFTYYPNPVKNTLTLNAQNTIEQIAMYNMLGQEVLRATPNTVDSDIDMSQLQTGTYFVKVTIANITETIRVIKQ